MASALRNFWRNTPQNRTYDGIAKLVLVAVTLITITRMSILRGDVMELPQIEGSGNALRQGSFLLCAALMVIACRPHLHPRKLIDLPISVLAVLALLIVSLAWSVAPEIGARRLALTIIVIWLAFRIVDQLGYERSMDLLVCVLSGLLLVNLAAVAITPRAVHLGFNVMQDRSIVGAWRGILPEKNTAGLATAVTILLLTLGAGRFRLATRVALISLAIAFLLGTESKTSILGLAAALAGAAMFRLYNPHYRILLIPLLLFVFAGVIYFCVIYMPPMLQDLASSQEAFTGRVEIWRALLDYVRDHPFSGAGFQTFWNVGPNSPINSYTNIQWIAEMQASGHSGYLDLATQIGLPGLALTIVMLFLFPMAKLLVTTSAPRLPATLQMAILAFLLVHNTTESTLLVPDQFGEFLLMLSIACVRDLQRRPAGRELSPGRRPSHRPLVQKQPIAGRLDLQ